MGFCGGCGQKSGPEDKFCTGCGVPIKEVQVSVLEDSGQVIKEEYRLGTAPPDAELVDGTHIGDKKKKGEWLEAKLNHILEFAGFQTKREENFVFNDSTGDRFEIDVLAWDPNIEIFVECKDYSDLKMSEKIMYTLTGQLDDYRKRQTKDVIGILAMTAKDDGRNTGIRENLKKHNCFLWDGSFIEHLENKMVELGNKQDFRRYVLDHLDIFEAPPEKSSGDDYDFMVKYSFFTISPREYVGKIFDVMLIIDDIRVKLPENIKIINHSFSALRDDRGKSVLSYNIVADFSMKLNMDEIKRYAKKHKGIMDRIRRRKPIEIAYRGYKNEMYELISRIYGVSYDSKKGTKYFDITFEGSRVE